jgi:hypothetical protein
VDVFKFLDDAVRGTVSFVYDFLNSTLVIVRHPIAGPSRLWRASRDPAKKQIGPTTYLTLAFLIASLAPVLATERDRGSEIGKALTRLIATGSLTSDIVPILIGVIVGTICIDVLLRIISQRLSATRRERFVGVLEYCIGMYLLILAPLANAAQAFLSEETATVVFTAPSTWIVFFLTIHFYALLFRRRRYYAWLRRVARVPRELRRDGFMLSLRKGAKGAWSLGFLWFAKAYLMLAVWALACLAPMSILLLAILANAETARWLSERPDGTAVLTVAGLRCGLDGDPLAARAILWNGSERPALDWSGRIWVRRVASDGLPGPRLRWHVRLPENRRGDLLLPGESMELAGRISGLTSQSLPAAAMRGWPCILEGGGNVRLAGV